MERKFELVEGMTTMVGDKKLYRIVAVRDFGKVKAGALGGYVDSELALSHDGNCWIADEALVYGGARVEYDAQVMDETTVSGAVVITDRVHIDGNAKIQNRTEYCMTIGNSLHITSGAVIENPDNYAGIVTHNGTVTLFRNESNGIDLVFYHEDELIHQSVSDFLAHHAKEGNLSFAAIMVLGAFCDIEQCMKAKADAAK